VPGERANDSEALILSSALVINPGICASKAVEPSFPSYAHPGMYVLWEGVLLSRFRR